MSAVPAATSAATGNGSAASRYLVNGAAPSGAPLLVTPVPADKPADQMDDAELLALFENTLYPNGGRASAWAYMGGGAQVDTEVVQPDYSDERHTYNLVTLPATMADLKANYEAVFSEKYRTEIVYPGIVEETDRQPPLFIEVDGKLYLNTQTGLGFGLEPDFSHAAVTAKAADYFEVEAPVMDRDIEQETRTFRAVSEGGYWVLENLLFYDIMAEIRQEG